MSLSSVSRLHLLTVSRYEDMSATGQLIITKEEDGDIIVGVLTERSSARVQFCSPGMGGGSSPRVLKALGELHDAITEENKLNPQRR